jgi:hypothetical protein
LCTFQAEAIQDRNRSWQPAFQHRAWVMIKCVRQKEGLSRVA